MKVLAVMMVLTGNMIALKTADKLQLPQFINVSADNLPGKDPSSNSMDVEAVDIDKDGDPDIVIASEFRPNLIYINQGNGKFIDESKQRLPVKMYDSEDIAAGDFDKDGDIDLIFASEDTYVHEYYLNDGKGYFSDVSERIMVKSKANAVLAHDFDKDGDLDVILGNEGQDIYLLNDGRGIFTDVTIEKFPRDDNVTQDVECADVDGDKDQDIIMGNEDGNKLYLNDGKGNFTDAPNTMLPYQAMQETRKVDLADVEGDGDVDILFSNVNFTGQTNPANRIFINDGKGHFKDETATRYNGVNQYHTGDAWFADMDGDRDLDLLIANVFGGRQQFFENDGKGVFTERTEALLPDNPSNDAIGIEVKDLNGDGKLDIYYSAFRSPDVLLLQK